jgi:3-methyladenine DNA glycosylase AlkC
MDGSATTLVGEGMSAHVRIGARSLKAVPKDVLARLNRGECECVNLMEWLATDMQVLSRNIFSSSETGPFGRSVLQRLPTLRGLGVTQRLATVGKIVSTVSLKPDHSLLVYLSNHKSDIVRQWAIYAINAFALELPKRLTLTRRFAADRNMTVRECAWMAFRPHLIADVAGALAELSGWVRDSDPNIRRFAIEVTRPRSVWGAHIVALKKQPDLAIHLLTPVRADSSHYVRTALGNWLNDAWKSAPEWVEDVCSKWKSNASAQTTWIIRRALRSKARLQFR